VESEVPGFIGLAILLVLSFYLTAAKTALGSARRQNLREQAEKGNRQAHLAAVIAEDSSRVLATFHVANIITHFLLASLAISLFLPPLVNWLARYMTPLRFPGTALGYLLIAILAALIVYLLTEQLPEVLVHGNPDSWAMALAGIARITINVMHPLVWLLNRLRSLIAVPLGHEQGAVTEEEIMTLVDAGEEEGSIQEGEKEMIYSIFQLDDTVAREIMVPRIDIVAVEIHASLEEARETILKAGHSRLPVYEGSLDHVLGLLYAKDLLSIWHRGETSTDLRSLLRPPMFVPESKRVPDLLNELQTAKVHMAVVIDEYGGTAGLVTLEDIVEEIVGEILDEYDAAEEALYETVSPMEFIFDARIDLDDFNEMMDASLPDEESDTLGGFIYAELGKVPEGGEVVQTPTLQLEVLGVEDRRIRKVRVIRVAREEPPAPGQGGKDQITNGSSNGH